MNSRTPLLIALALLLAIGAYFAFGERSDPELDQASVVENKNEEGQGVEAQAKASTPQDEERRKVDKPVAKKEADKAATHGSLIVTARYKRDDPARSRIISGDDEDNAHKDHKTRPAVKVPVFMRVYNAKRIHLAGMNGVWPWRKLSDDKGMVSFDELEPARYYISARRGGRARPLVVTLKAGEKKEVNLDIDPGVRVTGIVVDPEDQPVAGADIVTTGWASEHSTTLAQTDEDGRFDLEGIGSHNSIGARAKGFAPSMLYRIGGKRGQKVEMRIKLPARGASLSLLVVTPEGEAAGGAQVRVGLDGRQLNPIRQADGSTVVRIPLATVCDRQGRCEFSGVAAGEVPVVAKLQGYSPWEGSARVIEGQKNELTIRLPHAATMLGTIRNTAGTPRKGLWVMAGRHAKLSTAQTRTDDNGNYKLVGVPLGVVGVQVQGEGAQKHAKLTFTEGQTIRWEPAIPVTARITGQVLGPDGAGLQAAIEGRQDGGFVNAWSKKDGNFVLKNVVIDKKLRLSARVAGAYFPVPVYDAMPPASGNLILRIRNEQMPTVRIRGKLVDPEGKAIVNATISPLRRNHGNSSPRKPKNDGSFDFGPYPPGDYRLSIEARGWAVLRTPYRTLGPGDIAELGELRLEKPCTLTVALRGVAPDKVGFDLYDSNEVWQSRVECNQGTGTAGGLPSGRYTLQTRGKGLIAKRIVVKLRPAETKRISINVERGTDCKFDFDFSGLSEAPRRIDFRIFDGQGKLVISKLDSHIYKKNQIYGSFELRPGRYVVRAATKTHKGELQIDVPTSQEEKSYRIQVR